MKIYIFLSFYKKKLKKWNRITKQIQTIEKLQNAELKD
jgi:hypothetical protein